jgi:CheY-like chemotaxis protein
MARILVIDDDPALLRLVTVILDSGDYSVETANGGAAGLAALEHELPDLIILDLSMPGIDGRQFYRLARERGYSGPVMLFSAYNVDRAQRELGAEASIEKPFDPEMLIDKVGELVSAGAR